MTIRISEIAKFAGVSVATVSLVVNNKPGVGEATRKRILDIIKDSGYTPNLKQIDYANVDKSIRFLKYKKHGLVVDENGFISSLSDGVDIGARELGYDVVITTINEDNKESILSLAKEDPRAGIILLGTELSSDDLNFLKDIKVPVVIVDSYFELEDYDCVVMNNIDASYKAVKYLFEKGYKEIGHFESSVIINNFSERKEGYRKALKKLGLEFKPEYSFSLESTMEGAYRDMVKILEKKPKLPQAIFSDNDTIAVGAIKALKEFKVKIPEQLSIIGFDDIPFCLMIEPTLSTMRIYKEEIGYLAAKRLIEKIEKNDTSIIKMQVGAELIERNSTGK